MPGGLKSLELGVECRLQAIYDILVIRFPDDAKFRLAFSNIAVQQLLFRAVILRTINLFEESGRCLQDAVEMQVGILSAVHEQVLLNSDFYAKADKERILAYLTFTKSATTDPPRTAWA